MAMALKEDMEEMKEMIRDLRQQLGKIQQQLTGMQQPKSLSATTQSPSQTRATPPHTPIPLPARPTTHPPHPHPSRPAARRTPSPPAQKASHGSTKPADASDTTEVQHHFKLFSSDNGKVSFIARLATRYRKRMIVAFQSREHLNQVADWLTSLPIGIGYLSPQASKKDKARFYNDFSADKFQLLLTIFGTKLPDTNNNLVVFFSCPRSSHYDWGLQLAPVVWTLLTEDDTANAIELASSFDRRRPITGDLFHLTRADTYMASQG